MRVTSLFLLMGVLGCFAASAARANGSLRALSERELQRQKIFTAIHATVPEELKSSYWGQVGGQSFDVSSFGGMVTGTGLHGRLSLNFFQSMVTGWSGEHHVNLNVFGSMVTGSGPYGRVSLSVAGSHIFGWVGDQNVSVSVFGSMASGTFRGQSFRLSGFDALNPAGVAALLGSL